MRWPIHVVFSMTSAGGQAFHDSRVHRLPTRRRHTVMPHDDDSLAFTVDPRATSTLVVGPDFAYGAFASVGFRGGRGLQAVESEVALAAVEGVERSADPVSAELALRRAASDGLDELGVGREVRIVS